MYSRFFRSNILVISFCRLVAGSTSRPGGLCVPTAPPPLSCDPRSDGNLKTGETLEGDPGDRTEDEENWESMDEAWP